MACLSCKKEKCSCSVDICTNPLIYLIKDAIALVGTISNDPTIVTDLNTIAHLPTTVPTDPYALTLPEALVKLLRDGIFISTNKELCCPDCSSKNPISFFGDVELTLNQLTLYQENLVATLCCLEYQSTTASAEAVLHIWPNAKCCGTDFVDVIQQWINTASYVPTDASYNALFYLDALIGPPAIAIGGGFFETSSYNGFSGIGLLYNYLQLNALTLNEIDYLNILGVLSSYGVKVECIGCRINITKI